MGKERKLLVRFAPSLLMSLDISRYCKNIIHEKKILLIMTDSNICHFSQNNSGKYIAGSAQAERQQKLRTECQRDGLNKTAMSCSLSLVLVKYQLITSFLPKCGGTNWCRLLMNVYGYHNKTDDIPPQRVVGECKKYFPRLSNVKGPRRTFFMEHFKMVRFVRNPFIRLLSGFRDRLETYPNRNLGNRKMWSKKIFLFGNHSKDEIPDPSVPSELYNVTFKEFVAYYLAKKNDDIHWREQYKLCHPCLNFAFIGKVETYAQDVMDLLKFMGADPVFYPEKPLNPTNSKDDETLVRYYQTLTKEQRQKLVEKFEIDMRYFGYEVPQSIRRLGI